MIIKRMQALLLSLAFSTMAYANSCNEVLSNGVFGHEIINTSDESRLAVALAIYNMSFSEYSSSSNAKASGMMSGIGASGSKSEKSFNQWKKEFAQSLDINTLNRYQSSVYRSSGDKNILNAWTTCMTTFGGISATISYSTQTEAVIELRWYPPAGNTKPPEVTGFGFNKDVEIVAGQHYLKVGTDLGINIPRDIQIKAKEGVDFTKTGLIFTINTKYGDETAYLPPKPVIPVMKREICACQGHGGQRDLSFWGPKGEYCNGNKDWGVFSEDCTLVEEVCTATGAVGSGVSGLKFWGPKDKVFHAHWPNYGNTNECVNVTDSGSRMCGCIADPASNKVGGYTYWGPEGLSCAGQWRPYHLNCF